MITPRYIVLLFALLTSNISRSDDLQYAPFAEPSKPEKTIQPDKKRLAKKISFDYENEDLVNVINFIAAQMNINIILPMRPEEKITGKFTWHLDKKVTVEEGFDLLKTILDIAGYAVVPKPEYYEIVKSTKDISREPMPLFIGTAPEQLPQSEQQIRYIYYLNNIKLEEGEGKESELSTVLKTLLPVNSSFKLNGQTNSILIMAPSVDVREVMLLITQLDRPGFQEKMEVIKLLYADARIVAELFNNKILQGGDANKYRLDAKKANESTYFSKYVRIIANDRTNSLIVLGRPQAIERIQEFIAQYIDVKPDSGESIIHIYKLQYLDAMSFAEVLRNIVHSKKAGAAPEQSTAEKKAATGPERFFEDVIIAVDQATEDGQAPQTLTQGEQRLPAPKYYGSNNLIIAARNDDWKRLKELIEELDTPQPQVLIEVLIADITLSDIKALGNMLRNPAQLPMPNQSNFQSAQFDPGVVPNSFDNPATIGALADGTAADLGRLFGVDSNGNKIDTGPLSLYTSTGASTSYMPPGTTAISVSDSNEKTWSIAQILKTIGSNRILSHPHVISTANKDARIENTEIRIVKGDTEVGQGGAVIQKQVPIQATLKVTIRPRISIPDPQLNKPSTVNLLVSIDINEFDATASTNNNSKTIRNVTTNATVNSGDILALGGLIRTADADGVSETPVLSKIPIIGWLFKNESQTNAKTNLTVFISPTIIDPRVRGGIKEYTRDYVELSKSMSKSDMFSTLKDPITRWFFDTESPTVKAADKFVKQDEIYTKQYETPMPIANNIATKSFIDRNRKKKEQASQIRNMLDNMDDNPFERATDSVKVRPRF